MLCVLGPGRMSHMGPHRQEDIEVKSKGMGVFHGDSSRCRLGCQRWSSLNYLYYLRNYMTSSPSTMLYM